MSLIRGKDTTPELIVRRSLHRMGFRFRIHQKGLPGTPDVVLRRHKCVVFVNGCFWHGHDCPMFKIPETKSGFWLEKIGSTRVRDDCASAELRMAGWRVLTVWECAMKGANRLSKESLMAEMKEFVLGCLLQGEIRGADPRLVAR